MFVYSLRASTLKFFGVIALSVAVLILLVAIVPDNLSAAGVPAAGTAGKNPDTAAPAGSEAKEKEVKFTGIKTPQDRLDFLHAFGWEVEGEPAEQEEIVIPAEFDQVLLSYNDLQKQQGLDLEKYRRRTVTRYTYRVTNYPSYTGTVYANLLIYRDRVIGGDICSADVTQGFVHGFAKPEN